ncbi:hypothetical protein [Haloferax larsenii]|nr:hypothetical protein [Haloferax larsenii]
MTAFEELGRSDSIWAADPLGKRSHVLPWSLATLRSDRSAR